SGEFDRRRCAYWCGRTDRHANRAQPLDLDAMWQQGPERRVAPVDKVRALGRARVGRDRLVGPQTIELARAEARRAGIQSRVVTPHPKRIFVAAATVDPLRGVCLDAAAVRPRRPLNVVVVALAAL